MNSFWAYFWPIFGAGLTIGLIAGLAAFRAPRAKPKDREAAIQRWKRRTRIALACGAALAIAAAALWHGPIGGGPPVHRAGRTRRSSHARYSTCPKSGPSCTTAR